VSVSLGLSWLSQSRALRDGDAGKVSGDNKWSLGLNRDGGGLVDVGWQAAPGAASLHAFMASRHMHEYGTTFEQLGSVALAQRAWANLNPEAKFYDRTLTMQDYLASRWISHPYRLLDNCVVSDVGCAVIVTTAERARDLKQKPVYVKGIGFGDSAREAWWDKTNFTRTDGAHAKDVAFRQAGIGIEDVDVAELYDCFTAEFLLTLEDYGFCAKGEGGKFASSGALAPGGALPTNTGGGQLSGYYAWGMTPLSEAVIQARGHGGDRQADRHDVVLVSGNGGILDHHATLILSPERRPR
jgi:acetyl-CoA acetyltransferase